MTSNNRREKMWAAIRAGEDRAAETRAAAELGAAKREMLGRDLYIMPRHTLAWEMAELSKLEIVK